MIAIDREREGKQRVVAQTWFLGYLVFLLRTKAGAIFVIFCKKSIKLQLFNEWVQKRERERKKKNILEKQAFIFVSCILWENERAKLREIERKRERKKVKKKRKKEKIWILINELQKNALCMNYKILNIHVYRKRSTRISKCLSLNVDKIGNYLENYFVWEYWEKKRKNKCPAYDVCTWYKL